MIQKEIEILYIVYTGKDYQLRSRSDEQSYKDDIALAQKVGAREEFTVKASPNCVDSLYSILDNYVNQLNSANKQAPEDVWSNVRVFRRDS